MSFSDNHTDTTSEQELSRPSRIVYVFLTRFHTLQISAGKVMMHIMCRAAHRYMAVLSNAMQRETYAISAQSAISTSPAGFTFFDLSFRSKIARLSLSSLMVVMTTLLG